MGLFEEIPPVKALPEAPEGPRSGVRVKGRVLTEEEAAKLPKSVAPPGKAPKGGAVNIAKQREALAGLVAERVPLREAAEAVGLAEEVAKQLAASPFFQKRVVQIREALEAQVTEWTAAPSDILESEANRTIRTLTELRDTAISENVRLSAASKMLDLTPSVRRQQLADEVMKLVLSEAVAKQMVGVMREIKESAKAIDVSFEEVHDGDRVKGDGGCGGEPEGTGSDAGGPERDVPAGSEGH